jgi:hypothetical protein
MLRATVLIRVWLNNPYRDGWGIRHAQAVETPRVSKALTCVRGLEEVKFERTDLGPLAASQ